MAPVLPPMSSSGMTRRRLRFDVEPAVTTANRDPDLVPELDLAHEGDLICPWCRNSISPTSPAPCSWS